MKISGVEQLVQWLYRVNLLLLGCVFLGLGLFFLKPSVSFYPATVISEQKELPKSTFGASEEFFHQVGQELFTLAWVPPQMQLPDLRQELVLYKPSERPDFISGRSGLQIALKTSTQQAVLHEKNRLYLVYEGSYRSPILERSLCQKTGNSMQTPLWGEVAQNQESQSPTYSFSPDNTPTALWLEMVHQNGQSVELSVHMLDEKGARVSAPAELHRFCLQTQDFPKAEVGSWEMDGNRVDSTLLVRQKAKWVGKDLFLELHGGEEYNHVLGAERIDFQDGETLYSCFVQLNDFLVWENNRWVVATSDKKTQDLPLMVVKKIDDKILNFEIWDPEGKRKASLNLIRSREMAASPNVFQDFKFVGAKTWAQFTVECRNQGRMNLKPHDWLVLTSDGWKKLESPEQIDAFVELKLVGPLFVLDQMTKQNGKQVLVGHLFNASRTEVSHVELIASSTSPLSNITSRIPTSPPIKPKNLKVEGGKS